MSVISIEAGVNVTEDNASYQFVNILVSLDSASVGTTTVDYAFTPGTATAADFFGTAGTLTFLNGETTQNISVTVTGDLLDEDTENFTVTLSNASSGNSIGNASASVAISDDDAPPTISISDGTDFENASVSFTLTLSGPSGKSVTFDAVTTDGTAISGSDYKGGTQSLTFNPGETEYFLSIPTNSDDIFDPDETFLVDLSNVVNVSVSDGQGVGAIIDDDGISIADVSVSEGAGTVTITATRESTSASDTTVAFNTTAGIAGTSDFTLTAGTITILAGQLTGTNTITIAEDTLDEDDETFDVTLSGPVGGGITDGTATITILDNDATPTISINDDSVSEGNSGSLTVNLTVSLSNPSSKNITFDLATQNDTAASNGDYISSFLSFTINAGDTSAVAGFVVNGDVTPESDETFKVDILNVVNATAGDTTGTITILDEDTPTLSINDVSVKETAGTTSFTVTQSFATVVDTTVNYTLSNGTAVVGLDLPLTSGTLTIKAGDTTGTIVIPVTNDTTDEPDQTFNIILTGATNASILDGKGVGTIIDDDAPPTISVVSQTVWEGNAGSVNSLVMAMLSDGSEQPVSFTLTTSNGTATVFKDYTSATINHSWTDPNAFAAGLIVPVTGDLLPELNETVIVTISNPVNVTVVNATGTLTIRNDDINQAPSGSDKTISLAPTSSYTFTLADFGFTDPDGNLFKSVIFPSVPSVPELLLDGVPVIAGQEVPVALIAAGKLAYDLNLHLRFENIPVAFQVKDDGGTTIGGIDTDQSPNTVTLQIVLPVISNTPPSTQDDKATTPGNTTLSITGTTLTSNDNDPDGDTLKIVQVSDAVNGTVSLSSGNVLFTPTPGYTGAAAFAYLISDDRGGSATGQVAVTVTAPLTPPNAAPVTAGSQVLYSLTGVPLALKVSATDANGDPLTFSAGDPPHGSTSGGAGGAFVYTPDAGFTGPDSFVVKVSDGKGGTASQTVSITTVSLPAADDWKLFADDGWVGEVGGNGQVFGTSAYQEVAVFNVPGHVQFDASFNRGDDLICPKGVAADWMVYQQGANAIFFDGDTFVTIPVGTAGMAMFFEDGGRLLVIDAATGTMKIGSQVIDGTLRTVTAPPEITAHPLGSVDTAVSKLFLSEGGEAWLGGDIEVFGTNTSEKLWLYFGDIDLDASFARGGDQVFLAAALGGTEASVSGANVHLEGGDVTVDLTAGPGSTSLVFWDATKTLLLDTDTGSVTIGAQAITASSEFLTFA